MRTYSDNSGAMFTDEKRRSEKHPHMTGTLMVDGREWRIVGWWNKARDTGTEYRAG